LSTATEAGHPLRVISLEGLGLDTSGAWKQVVHQVQGVFEESRATGLACFYLDAGSIVPKESIARGYENLKAFHGLSDEVKVKYHSTRSRISRGWVPLFEEPAYEQKVSHVEAFDLGMEVSEEDAAGDPGIGPNVWPSELKSFRKEVYGLYQELTDVSDVLFRIFAHALELEDLDSLGRHSTTKARSVMRLLRYPPETVQVVVQDDGKDIGISAHTDFECFTLIHQSAKGLQVLGADGRWVEVPPLPDSDTSFVVLIGDMLECWTNGELLATPHRVVRPKDGRERMSLIRFNGLDNDTLVLPFPKFGKPKPKYERGIRQGDHLQEAADKAQKNTERLLEKGDLPPSKYSAQNSAKTL